MRSESMGQLRRTRTHHPSPKSRSLLGSEYLARCLGGGVRWPPGTAARQASAAAARRIPGPPKKDSRVSSLCLVRVHIFSMVAGAPRGGPVAWVDGILGRVSLPPEASGKVPQLCGGFPRGGPKRISSGNPSSEGNSFFQPMPLTPVGGHGCQSPAQRGQTEPQAMLVCSCRCRGELPGGTEAWGRLA